MAYALSAEAVRILIDQRGYTEFLDMLRELRRAPRPWPVVERHFMSVERLEKALSESLR